LARYALDGAAHGEDAIFRVDVAPLQVEQFAAAQA